jgi:hypothetical protein
MNSNPSVNLCSNNNHHQNELLKTISQQTENIRNLSAYLESEKAKLARMNEELDNIRNINRVYETTVPRIYEPFRF